MDPSLTPREIIERQVAAHEAATRADYERVGEMTLQERANMIDIVCRVAASQVAWRRQMGYESAKMPRWPESTWDLLKRYAPNGQL